MKFPRDLSKRWKIGKEMKTKELKGTFVCMKKNLSTVLRGAEDPVLAVRWHPNPRRLNYSSGEETGGGKETAV